jgi:membrane protease YdiL (CAAX protease family)
MAEQERGKAAFHWALAAVPVPLISVVLAAVAGVRALRDPAPAARGWARRLVTLGVVDLLLLVSVFVVSENAERLASADPRRPLFGLNVDGPRVTGVAPEMPAAEAGVQAGDVLTAIDGVQVGPGPDALQRLRAATDREVVVTLLRDQTRFDVRMTARPLPRMKADPYAVRPSEAGGHRRADSLADLAIPLSMAGLAWLATRRRPGPRAWRGFLLALALYVGGVYGTLLLFESTQGGLSYVALLTTLLAGHLALGTGGLLADRLWKADRPAPEPARRGAGRTFLLSVLYGLAVYPRAAIILMAVDLAATGGQTRPGEALSHLAQTLHGVLPIALFLLAVAVVGPIAEEIVFRGFLLPRLAARMGAPAALLVSAAVFGAMHASYGPYAALTGVFGWILGWARLSSGGLAVPVVLHMAYNGVLASLTLWSQAR